MVTKATRDVIDIRIRPITDGIDVDGDGSANFTIDGTIIGGNLASDGTFVNSTIQNLTVTTTFDATGAALTGTWAATYSDLAECYESDFLYDPGTVVKLGGDNEITMTDIDTDWDAFGIISADPAYVLNSGKDGLYLPVTLVGRVPCMVIGPVKRFQRLVAIKGGYARAVGAKIAYNLPVIGRAMESNDSNDVKLVEVAVVTVR